MIITLIAGLPASGKTTYAKAAATMLNAILIDDPRDFMADVLPNVSLAASQNRGCVICDPNLCEAATRIAAEKLLKGIAPDAEFTWLFFENNPDKCRRNLEYRIELGDDRNVLQSIKYYSERYTIPEGSAVIEIWQPSSTEENTHE